MSTSVSENIPNKFSLLTSRMHIFIRSADSAHVTSRRWMITSAIILAAVCLLAGALRLQVITHYKYQHPDEEIARAVVVSVLKTGSNDTNWERTDVVQKFRHTQYNFSSYYLFAANVERITGLGATDLQHPNDTLKTHLRELSAVIGALSVLLAGIFGWRVGGTTCGLAAALLSASCVTLFQDGIYARPETFVTALSLLLMLILVSDKIHRGLVLALTGLIIGVLIACKITFLLYLPFPLMLAPLLLSIPEGGKPSESHLYLWSGSILAYFIAIGVGFAIGVPYAVRYPWEYIEGLVSLLKQYENGSLPSGLAGITALLARYGNSLWFLTYTIGYPALILAVLGLARTIWRRDLRLLLVIAGPMLSLLYFMQSKEFYERNFSQALPVLFVLSGLGIQTLLDFVKGPGVFRWGVGLTLFGASLAIPVIVMGKAFNALDGRYQQKIDAVSTSLTKNGTVALIDGPTPYLKRLIAQSKPLCGSYVVVARVPYNEPSLKRLQARGYTVVARVESPFGDQPLSTLQAYLAASMVFLAAPKTDASSCGIEQSPLLSASQEAPAVGAPIKLSGDWPAGSEQRYQENDAQGQWPWPRFDSSSGMDENTGSLTIGPFNACGNFVVPYISGPANAEISLKIIEHGATGDVFIYEDVPPRSTYVNQWQQLTVLKPNDHCANYTVIANDSGTKWGQWIGVGLPVTFKH